MANDYRAWPVLTVQEHSEVLARFHSYGLDQYNPRHLPTTLQSVFIGKHFVAIVNSNDGDSLEQITDKIWWKQ